MKWEDSDLEIAKKCCNITTFEEIEELINNGVFIKVAEANDYEGAYKDYLNCNPEEDWISFEEFLEEINMGYGRCGRLEISRLLVLSNGIYYDKEYC